MILYLSMMGLAEPLGRTQVMNYVVRLAQRGWPMGVVSYEKPQTSRDALDDVGRALKAAGVDWFPRVLQQPATTKTRLEDLAGLLSGVGWLGLRKRPWLLHCRSYVAATAGYLLKRSLGIPFIFDIRGFWPDERVEAGRWKRGWVYSGAKRIERHLYSAADAIVSLTHAATDQLESLGAHGQPVEVIPTCVDLEAYRGVPERPREGAPRIGYLGSFGGRYLIDETVELFQHFRALERKAHLEVLTLSDPAPLRAALERHRVPEPAVSIGRVPQHETPQRLARMSATICLIKPGFASLASCPTKFGESLAAGCPVVCNPGIGDCAEIAARERVGVVTDLDRERFPAIALALHEQIGGGSETRLRCAQAAAASFSLDDGVNRYSALYERLLGKTPVRQGRSAPRPSVGPTPVEPLTPRARAREF